MVGTLAGRCRPTVAWCNLGMTFDLGSARIFSATLETYFYHKAIWTAETCIYFYLIVFSPLITLLQFINTSRS